MTTTEKLAQMEASEARNRNAEAIHRSIEIYARSILESLDTLAEIHGADQRALAQMMVGMIQEMIAQ